MLDQTVELLCPPNKAKKLTDTCRTRWIQRIDSYAVFMELLPALVIVLQAMVFPSQFGNLHCDWDCDGETVMKATGFLHHTESLPS